MAGKANNACHIVAMPFPALGHINPMKMLCRHLASKTQEVQITFVIEEMYIKPNDKFPNIRFATLPSNILPSEESRNADVISFCLAALTKLGAPFEQILDSLQPPPTFIITDLSLTWAINAGNRRNIPVAGVWISTISEFTMHCHLDLFKEKKFSTDLEKHANEVVDFIPGVSPVRVCDLPRIFLENGDSVALDAWGMNIPLSKLQYVVCPSIYELESQTFDYLRAKYNFPIYAFGPLIPYFDLNDDKVMTPTPDYIEWLNSQPTNSVLYISMGSSHSLTGAQTDELAAGLRSSGVRYLWVGRDKTSRLKEECGELGMVVPWCDQMRVLNHSSVGGFLTHCGLSSIVEAGILGVPMLAYPLFGDQIINSKLLVEDWKVGWRLREIGRNKSTAREAIAKTVEKFINGDGRQELMENVKQFQKIIKGAAAKDGSSNASLDAFSKDITRGLIR